VPARAAADGVEFRTRPDSTGTVDANRALHNYMVAETPGVRRGWRQQARRKKKGKTHRVTLGEYPAVTLEAARSTANAYIDQAKRGINPAKALEATASADGLTVRQLGAFGQSPDWLPWLLLVPSAAAASMLAVLSRIADEVAEEVRLRASQADK
jgi:hypothetical protein